MTMNDHNAATKLLVGAQARSEMPVADNLGKRGIVLRTLRSNAGGRGAQPHTYIATLLVLP